MRRGTPFGVTLVDTHCHLNDARAFPDPAVALEEALAAGVARLIVIGIDLETSVSAVALAERFDEVYATIGWHPNHAAEFSDDGLAGLKALLGHPKVVAVGEIGLDYYRDHASRDEQHRCLRAQLDMAYEAGLPVVFHCRDAYDDLLAVLEREPKHPWLFHCFAGNDANADRAVALDAYFGVDGPVTYKSADALRATLARLPRDRVVVETDAPWMSPHPHRGERNRPAWVGLVNIGLAGALGVSPAECAELTTRNAREFFGPLGL
jgi:TatD DNase family protein